MAYIHGYFLCLCTYVFLLQPYSLHASTTLQNKIDSLNKQKQETQRQINALEKNKLKHLALMKTLTKSSFQAQNNLKIMSIKNAVYINQIEQSIAFDIPKHIYNNDYNALLLQQQLINVLLDLHEYRVQNQIDIETNHANLTKEVHDLKLKIKSNDRSKHNKIAELEEQKKLIKITNSRIREHSKKVSKHQTQGPLSTKLLTPPVKGKLITKFGDKILDTSFRTQHIEIQPDVPQINAIDTGEVVLSRYIEGFGHMIVLSHSHDIYSIYAHCDIVLVSENNHVKKQQTIATIQPNKNKRPLYFAIRQGQSAINPLKVIKL